MRLTVFHNITIEERYRKSLARLTEGENLPQKEGLDLHYAIYNGGVLGLSVTDGNNFAIHQGSRHHEKARRRRISLCGDSKVCQEKVRH